MESNEKYWDKIAGEYTKVDVTSDIRLGYNIVFDILKDIVKSNVVLDYGCGFGRFARRVVRLGPKKIFAVDTSSSAIDAARDYKTEKVEYRAIESGDFDFIPDGGVDVAVITFVLCTIKDKKKIKRILKKVNRKLRKNGVIVVLEPNPGGPGYKFLGIKREKPKRLVSGTPLEVQITGMKSHFYDYWRSHEDYKEFFKDAGFKIERILEPKGEDKRVKWLDEKKQAPGVIIVARK